MPMFAQQALSIRIQCLLRSVLQMVLERITALQPRAHCYLSPKLFRPCHHRIQLQCLTQKISTFHFPPRLLLYQLQIPLRSLLPHPLSQTPSKNQLQLRHRMMTISGPSHPLLNLEALLNAQLHEGLNIHVSRPLGRRSQTPPRIQFQRRRTTTISGSFFPVLRLNVLSNSPRRLKSPRQSSHCRSAKLRRSTQARRVVEGRRR